MWDTIEARDRATVLERKSSILSSLITLVIWSALIENFDCISALLQHAGIDRAALNTPPEALLKGCCATVFVCRLGPVAFIAGVLRKINKALYNHYQRRSDEKKRENEM